MNKFVRDHAPHYEIVEDIDVLGIETFRVSEAATKKELEFIQ